MLLLWIQLVLLNGASQLQQHLLNLANNTESIAWSMCGRHDILHIFTMTALKILHKWPLDPTMPVLYRMAQHSTETCDSLSFFFLYSSLFLQFSPPPFWFLLPQPLSVCQESREREREREGPAFCWLCIMRGRVRLRKDRSKRGMWERALAAVKQSLCQEEECSTALWKP